MKTLPFKIIIWLVGLNEVFAQENLARLNSLEFSKYYNNKESTIDFEEFDKDRTKALYDRNFSLTNEELITIPVVFHSLIEKDQKAKMTANDVNETISLLNNAFSGELGSNKVDSKIRFCIHKSSSSGLTEKEISWKASKENLEKAADKTIGYEGIDPNTSLNIWVVNIEDEIAGIGCSPMNLGPDGIVVNIKCILKDKNYDSYSKTSIVHLVGRYLGLKPIWGDAPCQDDGILDTPIHNGPNYKCYRFGHMSTCSSNTYELTNNFMDALPDDCANSFTLGQIKAMRSILAKKGLRKNLKNDKTQCK